MGTKLYYTGLCAPQGSWSGLSRYQISYPFTHGLQAVLTYSIILAIISADESHEFFHTVPNETDDCVRGSYVSGLTVQDILRLERFESGVSEILGCCSSTDHTLQLYTKETVDVCLLRGLVNLNDIELETLIDANLGLDTSQTVQALTFVWGQPHEDLLPQPWSFEDFVNTKLERWG